jgi:hypothetical protein
VRRRGEAFHLVGPVLLTRSLLVTQILKGPLPGDCFVRDIPLHHADGDNGDAQDLEGLVLADSFLEVDLDPDRECCQFQPLHRAAARGWTRMGGRH